MTKFGTAVVLVLLVLVLDVGTVGEGETGMLGDVAGCVCCRRASVERFAFHRLSFVARWDDLLGWEYDHG